MDREPTCPSAYERRTEERNAGSCSNRLAFAAWPFAAEDDSAEPAQFAAIVVVQPVQYSEGLFVDAGLHGIEELQAFGGDHGDRLALIFTAAGALDQLPGLQAIDEPCNVGSAIEHAGGNVAAGVSVGMNSTKNSQHVILRARDAVLLADAIHHVVDGVGGDDHTQQGFLRGTGELRLLQAPAECLCHSFFITTNQSCVIANSAGKKKPSCPEQEGRDALG